MRLLRLDLLAFGSFTDRVIEIDRVGEAPRLCVIYGNNESGKSTALRAVSALLYGFPAQTQDNHVHENPRLRVGASLLLRDGSTLALVRRKGRTNTLLDEAGRSIGEEMLSHALGGVDERHYHDVFGLDHVGLRRGAQMLLEQNTGVGETLFQASAGGASVSRLLRTLDEELASLFRPRAQNPLLNEELRKLKEARQEVRRSTLGASEWHALNQERREAEQTRELHQMERLTVSARLQRLKSELKLLPLVAELAQLEERGRALADAPSLLASATEDRVAATRAIEELKARWQQVSKLLSAKKEQLLPLASESELTRIDAETTAWISDKKGELRKAELDLPRRVGELRAIEAEISSIIDDLRPGDAVVDGRSLLVSAADRKRVHTLAEKKEGLEARHEERLQQIRALESRLGDLRRQLGAVAMPQDGARLQHALGRASRLGDAEEALAKLTLERDQAQRRMSEAIARLAPWAGEPEALLRLRPPSSDTIEIFVERMAQRREEQRASEARSEELEERLRAKVRELEQHLEAGDVPSEAGLATLRLRRDDLWGPVQEVLDGRAAPDGPLRGRAFLDASVSADEMADRLWREAARVQTVEICRGDMARLHEDLAAIRARVDVANVARDAEAREWSARWAGILDDAPPPSEMKEWLRQSEQARRLVESYRTADAAWTSHATIMESARETLVAALAESSMLARLDREPSWDELIVMAQDELRARERARQAYERIEGDTARAERELVEAKNAARETERAREGWAAHWAASVACLGLGREALPEEARAVLERLESLGAQVAKAESLKRRIESMEQDREAFDRRVTELVLSCMPGELDVPLLDRADRLVSAHRRAHGELRDRARLEGEIVELQHEISGLEARVGLEQRKLDVMLRAAGVHTLEELSLVESRAAERRELQRAIVELERRILQFGEGASLEVLLTRIKGLDPAQVRADIQDAEEDLEDIEEKIQVLAKQLGKLDAQREALLERSSADASEQAEAMLARVADLARRYARIKLTRVVLRGQIEEYRKKHQGPILERANDLFPRLTVGAWRGLEIDYGIDDEPVLVCVRSNGQKVARSGLSDGTLDSLFLALRVASLHELSLEGETLPLILDDALVHFDDERVQAALAVLAELAQRMQVLLFTHHRRIVEIATSTLPPARLAVHELTCAR